MGSWNVLMFVDATFYARGYDGMVFEDLDDPDPTRYLTNPCDVCVDDTIFTEGMNYNEADIVEGVVLQDLVVLHSWMTASQYEYSITNEEGLRYAIGETATELQPFVEILFKAGRREQKYWNKLSRLEKHFFADKESKDRGQFHFRTCILLSEWGTYDNYTMEAESGVDIVREFDLNEIPHDEPKDKKEYAG